VAAPDPDSSFHSFDLIGLRRDIRWWRAWIAALAGHPCSPHGYITGTFLIALGYAFGAWALAENRFFSTLMRIQTDHRV
jgi:hypothetical protein